MNEPLLRAEDIAQFCNVKKRTVYEWARIGYIPSVPLGSCVRFERSAVERWLAARRKEGRARRIP